MRGGKRPGAGRRSGAITVKTRAIAEIAIAEGMAPLEVMLLAMRGYAAAQAWDRAAATAKDAAPYIHPKLSSIEHAGKDGGPMQIERIERVIVDPQHPNS
jgi:hypothetical protein